MSCSSDRISCPRLLGPWRLTTYMGIGRVERSLASAWKRATHVPRWRPIAVGRHFGEGPGRFERATSGCVSRNDDGCVRMWLEYIRYRFRLNELQNSLELAQIAALRALRNSPRCRSWRVVPAPNDPSLCTLEIEWDPGPSLTPFRGSEEFEQIHAVLTDQVKALEEADYRADSRLLQRILGGPEALFRLAEDIVVGVMQEPALAALFHSDDGASRGRLSLWLLEVLGGPDLFSSSFPTARIEQGPLADALLDLEERERLLEIARQALPSSLAEQGLCVLGSLRAYVPLHPPPPSGHQLTSEAADAEQRVPRTVMDRLGHHHPRALHAARDGRSPAARSGSVPRRRQTGRALGEAGRTPWARRRD